jgi:hypothetical protein
MINPNSVRYSASPQRLQRGGHWLLNCGYRSFWCDVRAKTPWKSFMQSQNALTEAMIHDPSRRPAP